MNVIQRKLNNAISNMLIQLLKNKFFNTDSKVEIL